jgi:hypothetical protein
MILAMAAFVLSAGLAAEGGREPGFAKPRQSLRAVLGSYDDAA